MNRLKLNNSIRFLSVIFCLFLSFWIFPYILKAQDIDILIKNGHVFDPKNEIDDEMDVAISNGKVFRVAKNISKAEAKKVIDASGMYVCPGLIDIHTHVFVGSTPRKFVDGSYSLSPDDFTLRAGVTTVVDAGTSGWQNFPKFKEQVVDVSKTRILAFLNIAGCGMTGDDQQEDIDEMDVSKAVKCISEYPNIIVGIKIGHYTGDLWTPFDRASEAARQTERPMFVECHLPQYTLKDQLDRMRSGDIITHSYEKVSERSSVIGEDGRVRPLVFQAREKGVFFDVGHGGAGFWFSEAIPALNQGLLPNSFGSDLHRFSMNAGMKDMLNIMSKYMAMGMEEKDILLRATWNPAKSIKREDLGNLSEGAIADVTVLSIREGTFGFVDAGKNKITGNKKFEAELTIRDGKIVWDLNGISATPFEQK